LTILLLVLPGNWMVFHWFKASFDFLHRLFEMCVDWTAGLPFYLDATGLSLSGLAICYLSVMAVLLYIRKTQINRFFAYGCAVAALLVLSISLFPAQQRFRLICFNAGMGDCSMAVFPDGQVLLVDTGPQSLQKQPGFSAGWFGSKAINWFKHNKITTIDILVLSHLHNDHNGGLSDVLTNLKVRNIIINRLTASTPEWKALVAGGTLREARISVLADTLSIPFAGSKLTFLHPGKDYFSPDANEDSSVLRLDYRGFSALFAGDITAAVEAKLVEEIPEKLDCDWLKAPHHGSRYSNSAGFIRCVSPQRVIITASRQNRFRFPHRDTMQRYRAYGVEPEITGNGSVQISLP
jgi:competence protein ComEC